MKKGTERLIYPNETRVAFISDLHLTGTTRRNYEELRNDDLLACQAILDDIVQEGIHDI